MSESPRSTPANHASADRAGDLDLLSPAEVFAFARRRGLLILGAGLALGLAVFVYSKLVTPAMFSATAVLAVVPPGFSSPLLSEEGALTVKAYQQILESPGVLAETRRRLVAAGAIPEGRVLRPRGNMTSRIFASKRAEEKLLSTTLEAIARAPNPDEAEAMANTWAEVLVERAGDVFASSATTTATAIEAQRPLTEAQLVALQTRRRALLAEHAEERGALDQKLSASVAAARGAHVERLSRERSETGDAFAALVAKTGKPTAGLRELAAVRATLAQTLSTLRLETVEEENPTPPRLPAEAAESEGIIAISAALSVANGLNAATTSRAVSEVANPAHTELTLRAAAAAAALTDADAARAIEQLQHQRSARLARADAEAWSAIELASAERRLALANHDESVAGIVSRLDREIAQWDEISTQLTRRYSQAVIARTDGAVDEIHLASPAARPSFPDPRKHAIKAGLGAVAGAALGLLLALYLDLNQAYTKEH